ncbi:MAG: hypothetical protein QXR00_04060, partial [Candidatus Bathyarchaeia archaeon]
LPFGPGGVQPCPVAGLFIIISSFTRFAHSCMMLIALSAKSLFLSCLSFTLFSKGGKSPSTGDMG